VSDQDPFKMSCKFTTEIKNYDTISIREQVNGMIGKFAETIIHTREHAVRDALGKLGWMTPEQVAAMTSERDQLRADLAEEQNGKKILRVKYGAKPSETFGDFVVRLTAERDQLRADLQVMTDRLRIAREETAGLQEQRDNALAKVAELQAVVDSASSLLIAGWSFTACHPRGTFFATKPGYQWFSPGACIPSVDGMSLADVIRAAALAAQSKAEGGKQ